MKIKILSLLFLMAGLVGVLWLAPQSVKANSEHFKFTFKQEVNGVKIGIKDVKLHFEQDCIDENNQLRPELSPRADFYSNQQGQVMFGSGIEIPTNCTCEIRLTFTLPPNVPLGETTVTIDGRTFTPDANNTITLKPNNLTTMSDGKGNFARNNEIVHDMQVLIKPAPACNLSCAGTADRSCDGAKDGCTACLENPNGGGFSCQKPTPTPMACNVSCEGTGDRSCEAVKDGCTACLPSGEGFTCQKPTPTPTPAPACNESCVPGDADRSCNGAKDGCTVCRPNASGQNTCQPPIQYSDAMCKCDGITSTTVYPGQSTSVSAFAKVAGGDTDYAQVKDFTFYLAQDNRIIAKSNPIAANVIQNEPGLVRSQATWNYTFPISVSKTAVYRVWAKQTCQKRSDAPNQTASRMSVNSAVLAETCEAPNFFEDPIGSIAFATGLRSCNSSESTNNTANASVNPSASTDTTKLQLDTLGQASVSEGQDINNCTFLMYKFDK